MRRPVAEAPAAPDPSRPRDRGRGAAGLSMPGLRNEPRWLSLVQRVLQRGEQRFGRPALLGMLTLGLCVFSALFTFSFVSILDGVDAYFTPANLLMPVLTPLIAAPLVAGPMLTALGFAREIGERYRHLAEHDMLTGVLNRHGLFHGRAPAFRGELVVVADLNEFKQVNDTLGHAAGDELLQAVARALAERFGVEARIGRTGGDEFVVVTRDRGEARPEQLSVASPSGLKIRVSLGYAVTAEDGPHGLEAAIAQADQAMYEAKRHEAFGRGHHENRRHRLAVVRSTPRDTAPSDTTPAG